MRGALALTLSILVLAVSAACSDRVPVPGNTEPPPAQSPTPTPTPLPPVLDVALRLSSVADQGFEHTISIDVRRQAFPAAATLDIDFGDGTTREIITGPRGTASVSHAYSSPGEFKVAVRAAATNSRPGGATAEVTVNPRMVVFIQGMNSSSHCPDGRSFTTRAPQWLSPYLFEPANTGGLALTPDSYAYFSYSGRWCTADGAYRPGATADYRASDTCGGIDEEHAGRLRAFIDSFAPARVAVVGHSMGGLVAAYLVASDPEWAREHIVSVATFDSPLRGVNGFRIGIVGAGGILDGDCGPRSDAVKDLWDDSDVVAVASAAASFVPFYTADATDGEGPTFGQVEAVPGGASRLDGEAAHTRFGDEHSETWSSGGKHVDRKRLFVACAITLGPATCLDPLP